MNPSCKECGSTLSFSGVNNPEEYAFDFEGVINVWHCSNCHEDYLEIMPNEGETILVSENELFENPE